MAPPQTPREPGISAGDKANQEGGSTFARRPAGQSETARANRSWWDGEAEEYYREHGEFLGDDDLIWGPERLREADLGLLGDVGGLDVLEIGAGAAQGSRFVAGRGARVVASDLSIGMLRQARLIAGRARGPGAAGAGGARDVPLVQCDAVRLPFADGAFDIVFTSYGAVPFIADTAALMRECGRVLRSGGRLVFSTSHPLRWAFPDVPGSEGLTVNHSYFDRTPYVETRDGRTDYVEHHRTLGDRVRELVAAGLVLVDLVEPEWPASTAETWGGWSPLRGRLIPGTLVVVAIKP